jgi:uncharacterized membrane protein (UPF0127 family)
MIPEASEQGNATRKFTSLRRRSLGVFAVLGALLAAPGTVLADPLLTFPLEVRGHELRAELANTDETRRTGLMFRKSLAENGGMLFVYEVPGRHAMWMKNTLVPLSVAFIGRDGRIINIEDMEPLSEQAHASRGEAWYSLEVNRGWFAKRGIRPGDRLEGLKAIPH